MWSSNIFQVTRQYIFVCGRLADIPRQQLRRSGSCYTSRTAKLLNCFLRIFKLLQLWHAVIPTLSVRFNIRCLVQKGLFCWLIHLINPINYFGDFHNTLQSSSCTMCRVQILTYLSKDSSWSVMFAPLILICCPSSVIVLDLLFSRTWLDVLFTPSVHNLCRYEHHEKVSYINMVQSKIF